MTELTLDRLKELIVYDADTGVFSAGPKRLAGRKIGCIHPRHGRLYIWVDGKIYAAARLAWFYQYGKWPERTIDHIDCDRLNNAIGNLRDVPIEVNKQNQRKAKINNKLGIHGIRRRGTRYEANITVNKEFKYLGSFATAEEAHNAFLAAKRIYHPGYTG